ncbi:MAG: phosphoribosylamine--glycine ligase [Pseudomonadota bacterium]|nr:MAG: phosphoribosylamine--glycine ligase [Pseudomonadota bacterium]
MASRKILVLGSGGREHALALRLLASPSVREVIVVPGNAGTARPPASLSEKVLRNASGSPLDVARAERPDLVVIGPEQPLCDGLADALAAEGHLVFGPSRAAARLEGSKAFMKEFATRHGIPTARHVVVSQPSELDAALATFSAPPVVKADGLCAGKGVLVAPDHESARRAALAMLSGESFGDAGRTVVLEERIEGQEASIHAICDGERYVLLPAAQDHKRIFDGDAGPNTGGMGTYAPAPLVTEALARVIEERIVRPTFRGMAAEGTPFRGTLFAGLMITSAGEPMLLEFNVRFGDPETQVLMETLDGDFAEALVGAARGALAPDAVVASNRHALCVVVAASGYPGTPRTGDVITGLEEAEAVPGVRVYHAGTRLEGGRVLTAGGRVLGVTASASALDVAHERAYAAVARLRFEGMQFRRDIGTRALTSPRA